MENALRSSLPDRMGGRTCIVSENAVSIAEAMAREAACYHPILIMWRDAVLFDGCYLTIDEFAAATNKETLDACRQEGWVIEPNPGGTIGSRSIGDDIANHVNRGMYRRLLDSRLDRAVFELLCAIVMHRRGLAGRSLGLEIVEFHSTVINALYTHIRIDSKR
jgi:hypothetical protein